MESPLTGFVTYSQRPVSRRTFEAGDGVYPNSTPRSIATPPTVVQPERHCTGPYTHR